MMAAAGQPKLIVEADAEALAQAAAERVMARIEANLGRIAICLTGGSSPTKLYQLLGSDAWRGKIPWERVHWFIGDERFVPESDPLNNMAIARATFLDRNAPPGHIHPIPTAADNPDQSAAAYARELQSFYGAESLDPARPLFDMVLMGAGPDGHTASLFPGYPAIEETMRWVVGGPQGQCRAFRAAGIPHPARAGILPRNAVRDCGARQAADLDAPPQWRDSAGCTRALEW
ncbi:6-phosphogluconolactonase [Bradyrhizobium sp. LM3.2]